MNYIPPPDQQAYYEQVWGLARQVPHGNVATYGQLAQMLSPPQGIALEDYKIYGPRWVGDAMAACPEDVPWQRIINSQGKVSNRFDADRQRRLLEDEGLLFVKDRINLKMHQWGSTDQEAAPRQETLF